MAFIDRVPVGIQECNASGTITLSNAFHCRMHGYLPGELVGRSIFSLVKDPKQRAELTNYLKFLVREQPEPTPYYSVDRCKYGGEVAVRVDWVYERDTRDRVVGFLCAISQRAKPSHEDTRISDAVTEALSALRRVEQLLGEKPVPNALPLAPLGTPKPAELSARERQILDELLRGRNPARIADALAISVHTVRNHMKSIYRRFNVHSREELSAVFLGHASEPKR